MATELLKASPDQVDALQAKRLREFATKLRQRNERTPGRYGRIGSQLQAAEQAIERTFFATARDELEALEDHMDACDAEVGVRASQLEQEAQGDRRNAPTHTAETGAQTRDGWLWLLAKQRISAARRPAGERFRELFARAQDSLRSCTADFSSGGGESPVEVYNHSRFELDGVKLHFRRCVGAETGEALYGLLVKVCGRGETVRSVAASQVEEKKKDRAADALQIELGLALDMAGVYFGMIRG